jgi:hypothetical protein
MQYPRRYRYAVPVVVMAAIGAGVAAPDLSGASSAPDLAPMTPAQLLAEVAEAKPAALSGVLTWTANLGLSDLSTMENELSGGASSGDSSAGFSPLSLLAGTYSAQVWVDGAIAQHFSFSASPTEEYDFVHSLDQIWLWDSTNETVRHLVFQGAGAAEAGNSYSPLTPQQVASEILARASASTSVTSGPATYVAGQPAYQLIVSPRDPSGTTVGEVVIGIGGEGQLTGVPLRVTVFAKGQSAPALQVGFTGSLDVGAPPTSELTFIAPPGSKVVTKYIEVGKGTSPGAPGTLGLQRLGTAWESVVTGTAPELVSPAGEANLLPVTTAVEVDGQPARLFSTDLLNVLIMPGGRFYAGFVVPSLLEADAAAGSVRSASSP